MRRYIFWVILVFLMGFFIPFANFKLASFAYRYYINSQNRISFSREENKAISLASRERDISKFDSPSLAVDISNGGISGASNITSLIFVGDIMLDRGVSNSVLNNAGGDFSFLFERAEFIKDADISFGNLEGPISNKGKDLGNLYSFRFEPSVVEALKNGGFDVLSVANNHIGDWGKEAFEDTVSRLAANNIVVVGGGQNLSDAKEVKTIKNNGMKIGFLAFSDVGPNWLKATDDSAGILIANDEIFSFLIRQAASQADVLIVSLHFGEEYHKNANDRQKKLARLAIDSGAKIVVGHHAHIAQEVEYYKNGVIAYSLGNFIFDQNFSEETMQGLALEIILKDAEIISVRQNKIKINNFFQPELIN